MDLQFSKLAYSTQVGIPLQEIVWKTIITGVSGRITAGRALAIIGPSGAGKSTLLDCLSGRKTTGQITGSMTLNGKALDQELFASISAYIPQDDVMLGGLTVWETIMFSAQLRLPDGTSKQDLAARVNKVIDELGLQKAANAQIGTEMRRGISGGEKKRVSIGTELVTQPGIIFLDEPTTGLDSTTAINLISNLAALATKHRAVVFSIHQPSSFMWSQLDYLLVLTHQGTQAYFGKAAEAVGFFEACGLKCDPYLNPAEFLIDVVASQHAKQYGDFDLSTLVSKMKDRVEGVCDQMDIQDVEAGENASEETSLLEAKRVPILYGRPKASCFKQYKVILWRFGLAQIRDPTDFFVQLTVAVCFAGLIGSIYHHIPLTEAGIQDRSGGLFFMMMNAGFSNLGSLNVFIQGRHLFVRERAAGMYKTLPFFVGKTLPDIPKYVVSGVLFGMMAYSLMGLNPAPGRFSFFLLIMFILTNISYALCLMVSSFAPSFTVANMIAPLLIMLLMLPSGFLVNTSSLPWFWKWLHHFSFFHYGYEALVINEFDGLQFEPKARGITGSAVIKRLDMSVDNFFFDIQVLVAMWFFFMVAAYFCLHYLQKEKR